MSISHHGGDCILRASESDQCRHGEKSGVHILSILFACGFFSSSFSFSSLLYRGKTDGAATDSFQDTSTANYKQALFDGIGIATEHGAGRRQTVDMLRHMGHGWTSGSAWTLLVLQEGRDTQHRRGFSGSLVRRSIQQGAGHCFFDGTRGQEDEGSERAVSLFAFIVWPGDMDLQKDDKKFGMGSGGHRHGVFRLWLYFLLGPLVVAALPMLPVTFGGWAAYRSVP